MRTFILFLLLILSEHVFTQETPEINPHRAAVEFIPADDNPELLRDRLECIEQTIPLTYNDRVHAFINYFTVKDREYTRMVAGRKSLFFPMFEGYLAKYGLPDELKYLSIIESGLNPNAISRARAVGLWQFMSATGRHYGMQNNWYIDDRMDPEKSTEGACRYLLDLYRLFGDWELAIAAYNTGPGNVKKAIRRSGYKKSFWEIYRYLPRETRSYLPQFVAIIYAMNHLGEHNFYDIGPELFIRYDTLEVGGFLNLRTLANLSDICFDDLKKINPEVLREALPEGNQSFTLNIPRNSTDLIAANRAQILDSASNSQKHAIQMLAQNSPGNTYGRERIAYRVNSGDVLGSIALRHKVRVSDIREWNNLMGNTIRIGQSLIIWVLPGSKPDVQSIPPADTPKPLDADNTVYIVQPGDTLWDISRKYQGLTIEQIKSLNKLTSNKIHPGQKLILGM